MISAAVLMCVLSLIGCVIVAVVCIVVNSFAEMSNRELVNMHNNAGSHQSAVEIIRRAETALWDDMFARASENSDLLIRLHGYITSMQTDFLFGSYITLGPERNFSAGDIHVTFDSTPARIGDEVIIFLIPVFAGYDTPLRSWEWTQIRNR